LKEEGRLRGRKVDNHFGDCDPEKPVVSAKEKGQGGGIKGFVYQKTLSGKVLTRGKIEKESEKKPFQAV